MRKIVTQLIVEAKDRTAAVFKSILSSVRSTEKAVKDQSAGLDGAARSVEKLATADKKLSLEQRKLDTSAAKLAIAERQLASQFRKIAVDAKNASTAEQKLSVQNKRLSAASKSLTNDQRRLAIQQKQVALNAKIAAKNQGEFSRGVKTSSKNVSKLGGTLRSAGKTLLAFFAVRQVFQFVKGVIQTADAFKEVQARIKLATDGINAYATANASLFLIAQRTRTGFNDLANLFSRTNEAIKNLGLEQKDTLNFVELVGKANKVSGASATESAASIRQLTQALQSGVLRGDEFNSVMENSPRIVKALAAGLDVPIGALREMAKEGELTAERVIRAILSQSAAIDTEFNSIPKTVSGVVTQLNNIWNKGIGELDTGSGFSKVIIAVFEDLQTKLTSIFTFLKNNASSVSDGFRATITVLGLLANGIRAAFNVVTIVVSSLALAVSTSLEAISRAAAAVTFGDASKKWKQEADAFAGVSKTLRNQIEADAGDIAESIEGLSNASDSSSLDKISIELDQNASLENAKAATQGVADEIKNGISEVNPEVNVLMRPDVQAAIASINQTRDQAQEQVKPIVIPVVFENTGGNSFSDKPFADELRNEALKRGRVR